MLFNSQIRTEYWCWSLVLTGPMQITVSRHNKVICFGTKLVVFPSEGRMSRAFGLLVRWLSFHLHHLSSLRMWSLLSDGWFSSTQSRFSQWNANHPLAGALPGLGGFKVTFSFAEDEETFNFIVCWFSPSFISWSYKMTLMTQLGLQHTVAIIYTTGLVIFLITMAPLYNSQSLFFCLQFRSFTPGQHCLLSCVELNQAKKDLSRRETR